MSNVDIVVRIVVATLLSAVIGYERETARKPAGLRTHALVGLGAAMFSVASIVGFDAPDQSRIAAQIVTGVGFLGAGAIFRAGLTVEGLTTAAGLWTAAAIGMASGAGEFVLAVVGTVAVLAVLFGLRVIDNAVARRLSHAPKHVEVTLESPVRLSSITKFTERIDVTVGHLGFERSSEGGGVLTLAVHPDRAEMVAEMLSSLKGVSSCRVVPAVERRRLKRSD